MLAADRRIRCILTCDGYQFSNYERHCLALLGSALLSDHGIVRHERLSELRRIEKINGDFADKNATLREEVQALRTDHTYVESVIRDELGWVRADEYVVIVPLEESEKSP